MSLRVIGVELQRSPEERVGLRESPFEKGQLPGVGELRLREIRIELQRALGVRGEERSSLDGRYRAEVGEHAVCVCEPRVGRRKGWIRFRRVPERRRRFVKIPER